MENEIILPQANGQSLRLEFLLGEGLEAHVNALAALRIRVFREWPYLYEGTLEYERHYLDLYCRSPRSLAILVWDGGTCVGASTALPLSEAVEAVQQPFVAGGKDLAQIDYFGESLLLPAYRGRGLGVRFFEHREAHARALGLRTCAFCSVERPAAHPLKPADYVPNDAFWTRRGYHQAPEMRSQFDWPDIGESLATSKPMTFWLKTLPEAR